MRSIALTRRALSRNVRVTTRFLPATRLPAYAPCRVWTRGFARVDSPTHRAYDVYDKDDVVNTTTDGSRAEGRPPPDQRTLKLGKTKESSAIRTLHERLPSLLASPLPQDILSPEITLHLFPSTHPHLPTVSGRIPYTGALWTAPVAWGRLPLLGNVKLEIMSERMVRNGGSSIAHEFRDEKLIVKWKTCGKTKERAGTIYRGIGATEQLDKLFRLLGGDTADEEFCGLFIFEFDSEGRISKHTIEHADEGGNYDRMTKVVSVTDWLLGRAPWRRKDDVEPGLAFCEPRRSRDAPLRPQDRPREQR
ncbi:hypothetical protein ANO11243_040870 [Dothideomycetidae sp. 11243]|nr:hypothetical protein ANO11243_040870 [fungal sp. No.11243]